MRLEPLAVYVLDCFRSRQASSLPFAAIAEDCTQRRRAALKETIEHLRDQSLVVRPGEAGGDIVELTEAGLAFVAMASAESAEHFSI